MAYDVFISAKSEDYPHARKAAEFLREARFSVFFSEQELREMGNSDYFDAIDNALESSRHMLVVTSSRAHVDSPWVKKEWQTYLNEKLAKRKTGNVVTLLCDGMKIDELPLSLRQHEARPSDELSSLLNYFLHQREPRNIPANERAADAASQEAHPKEKGVLGFANDRAVDAGNREAHPWGKPSVSSRNVVPRAGKVSDPGGAFELVDPRFGSTPFVVFGRDNGVGWLECVDAESGKFVSRTSDQRVFADGPVLAVSFHVTDRTYRFNASLEARTAEIVREFGPAAEHGSFEDLQFLAGLLGSDRLIDLLDLRKVRNPEIGPYEGVDYWNQGPFVTYKGAVREGPMAYFASVHDGEVLSDWAIVDTIDHHSIDLGRWYDNRNVLVRVQRRCEIQSSDGLLSLDFLDEG